MTRVKDAANFQSLLSIVFPQLWLAIRGSHFFVQKAEELPVGNFAAPPGFPGLARARSARVRARGERLQSFREACPPLLRARSCSFCSRSGSGL